MMSSKCGLSLRRLLFDKNIVGQKAKKNPTSGDMGFTQISIGLIAVGNSGSFPEKI
jgi:hypothetical protein